MLMTYRVLILNETLVIPTQADEEQDTRHVSETMYPLSSLRPLTTDIDYGDLATLKMKDGFRDANRPNAALYDVLFGWLILGIK